jgi:hypothetical protein
MKYMKTILWLLTAAWLMAMAGSAWAIEPLDQPIEEKKPPKYAQIDPLGLIPETEMDKMMKGLELYRKMFPNALPSSSAAPAPPTPAPSEKKPQIHIETH